MSEPLERKKKKAKEYFIVLDGEFVDGKATATVYKQDPNPTEHFETVGSIRVVPFSAYADALATIAILQADHNEETGEAEVPGTPTPDGRSIS